MSSVRFGDFHLDPADRQLRRDGRPVEINARYLDALALLVSEPGRLVSKDRFLDEVWRGVPVTDEALTQCIKTLRRQLGDDAARPRFIETVPKHGYRFIAPVEPEPGASLAHPLARGRSGDWREFAVTAGAGTLGGGAAGVFGGLFYGFAGASQPLQAGIGAASVLLVLVCLTVLIGLIGAGGVALGIAAAGLAGRHPWQWAILGGAAGGLIVGAFARLLGLDAFTLLFGQSPGDITGAGEGALLGSAVGLGAWAASRGRAAIDLRRAVAAAGLAGAAAGLASVLLGGELLGGSLDSLARQFPDSRLSLDEVGRLFGETGFGPVSRAATGAIEGMLFGMFVIGAMVLARRKGGFDVPLAQDEVTR